MVRVNGGNIKGGKKKKNTDDEVVGKEAAVQFNYDLERRVAGFSYGNTGGTRRQEALRPRPVCSFCVGLREPLFGQENNMTAILFCFEVYRPHDGGPVGNEKG